MAQHDKTTEAKDHAATDAQTARDEMSATGDLVKTKVSAIAGTLKSFRDKLEQGGLSAEDKALLGTAIAELDALYAPARATDPGPSYDTRGKLITPKG